MIPDRNPRCKRNLALRSLVGRLRKGNLVWMSRAA